MTGQWQPEKKKMKLSSYMYHIDQILYYTLSMSYSCGIKQ